MVRALVSQLKWSRVPVPVVPRSGNNSGQVPLSPSSYRLKGGDARRLGRQPWRRTLAMRHRLQWFNGMEMSTYTPGARLQNILRQSYDYFTLMPKL